MSYIQKGTRESNFRKGTPVKIGVFLDNKALWLKLWIKTEELASSYCEWMQDCAKSSIESLLLGVYLNFNIDSEHLKSMIKLLGIRYAAGLTVGFALFFLLPLGELFRYTMLIGFILPIPSAILAYTVQYEYDEMYVGSITNLNTVISFLLIWCIIAFAK